jgi:hypothetical protein
MVVLLRICWPLVVSLIVIANRVINEGALCSVKTIIYSQFKG